MPDPTPAPGNGIAFGTAPGSVSQSRGFSLVELVIVVVVLGLLAAIAVPRISRGTISAAESTLRKDLMTMRSAINHYAAEHHGDHPGQHRADGSRNNDGTLDDFVGQMLHYTNPGGQIVDADHPNALGPYLVGPPRLNVGVNAGSNGNKMQFDFSPELQADDNIPVGWLYNPVTGNIIANSQASDSRGKRYQDY